jgi:hypothetical protein
MTSYKFTGEVEEIFPFGLLKPGQEIELPRAVNHPRLERVDNPKDAKAKRDGDHQTFIPSKSPQAHEAESKESD